MGPSKNKGGGNKKSKDAADEGGSSKKSKEAQTINVRHILCEKMSKKDEALTDIRAGMKFDEAARKYSEDKARQGGSLGWKTKADLEPNFASEAFQLELSTVNKPVLGEAKTQHGYHIIMVEGKK